MSGLPATTMLAAAAGILGSAWNSGKSSQVATDTKQAGIVKLTWNPGGQAMLSILGIPGLLSATSPVPSQLLAQQWAGIYNRGKVLGPRVAVIAILGYGYLVHDRGRQGRSWGVYLGAMGLTIGIVPFTLVFMDSTNQALLNVAQGASALDFEAVSELLLRWKGLNLIRSLFPMAGALLGLYGLVGPW